MFLFDEVPVSVLRIPFSHADPDLSAAEILDRWAVTSGGGCPTLVGELVGLPACVEVVALNTDRGYARLRAGGLLRLGTPAA